MNDRIVVPVDGSEPSLQALDAATKLAADLGAILIVCHVVDVARVASMSFGEPGLIAGCVDALESEGEAIVRQAVDRATARGATVQSTIVEGGIVEQIHRVVADTHAGWIVMGSHGRTGLSRLLMGSVAEGVIREAKVPVMIVPFQKTTHAQPVAANQVAAAGA